MPDDEQDEPQVEPDLNFLARFLRQGQYLEFRLKGEDSEGLLDRFFLNDLSEVPRRITDENVHVWFGVANRRSPESGDATGLGHVHFTYVDLDHMGAEEALERIVRGAELPMPTFLVNSGHGVHAYWELEKPLDLSDERNRVMYKACEEALVAATGADERAKDPTRVLRVPGTWNPKDPRAYCRLVKRGRESYPLEAFNPGTGIDKLIWIWKHTKVHQLALGIAGWCYHKGVAEEDAKDLLSQVVSAANDPEIGDRLRCIRDAYEGGARGKEIAFKPHLDSPMGKLVLEALEEVWGRRPDGGPLIERRQGKDYVQPTTQGVDWLRRYVRKDTETWDRTHVITVPLRYDAAFDVEGTFMVEAVYQDRFGEVREVTDFSRLPSLLRSRGVVMAQAYLEDTLGALRYYHLNNGISVQQTRPTIGIYHEEARFKLYLEDAKPMWTPQEMQRDAVLKQTDPLTRDALETYLKIIDFYDPKEVLPVMGLAAMAPFLYALKEKERVEMVPFVFIIGPHGLGKTTLNAIFTSRFYGTQKVSGKAFGGRRTDFRPDDYLNSMTLPLHVEEGEDVAFDEQAPKLKIASDSAFLSSKGKPSREQDVYMARSTCFFDGNNFPIHDWNLMIRFILISMDEEMRPDRERRADEFLQTMRALQRIGMAFLQRTVEWMNDAAEAGGIASIDLLSNTVEKYRDQLSDLDLRDPRRATVWAQVYTGLQMWSKVCKDHNLDFSISMDDFKRDVVAPLESALAVKRPMLTGVSFYHWWRGYLSRNTFRRGDTIEVQGRGDIFVEDERFWYVTQAGAQYFGDGRYTLSQVSEALAEAYERRKADFYDSESPIKRTMGDGSRQRVLRLPKNLEEGEEGGPLYESGEQTTFTDQVSQYQAIRSFLEETSHAWFTPDQVAGATGVENPSSWLTRLVNERVVEASQGRFRALRRRPPSTDDGEEERDPGETREEDGQEAEGPMEAMEYARMVRRTDPQRPANFLIRDLMDQFNLSRADATSIARPLYEDGESEE